MSVWVERNRSGSYVVRWREDGRKRSRSFRTAEDADAFTRELAARDVLRNMPGIPGWGDTAWVPEADTEAEAFRFETYLRRQIEDDTELRETVRETYRSAFRTRIAGTPMARADLRSITPEDVRGFFAGVDRNRRTVHRLVGKTFNAAIREGIIDASPLMRSGLKAPRPEPYDGRRLNVSDIERLSAAAAFPRVRIAIRLMGYCGLRAGEVAGLRAQDVNGRRISIRQQVVAVAGRRVVTPPKTKASRRTITVPSSVADELGDYMRDHPPADDGRILYLDGGRLWSNSGINAAVHHAAHMAGMPPVHSHQLRHAAVALLIDAGHNPKAIQVFVGHATITETLQTYGSLFDEAGDALADSMERRIEAHRNGNGDPAE